MCSTLRHYQKIRISERTKSLPHLGPCYYPVVVSLSVSIIMLLIILNGPYTTLYQRLHLKQATAFAEANTSRKKGDWSFEAMFDFMVWFMMCTGVMSTLH